MNIKRDLPSITALSPPPPAPPLVGRRGETGKHVSGFAENAKARQTVSCLLVFEMWSLTFAERLFIYFFKEHATRYFLLLLSQAYDVCGLVKVVNVVKSSRCFSVAFHSLRSDVQA